MLGPKGMTGNVEAAPAYTSRWEERDARRQENARIAREAAARRAARKSGRSVKGEVEKWQRKLTGANVPTTLALAETVSSMDRDYFILAEKYGPARRSVLQQLGAPRGSVETEYLSEVGLASPTHTPDEGV